jgi:hypothetical protein
VLVHSYIQPTGSPTSQLFDSDFLPSFFNLGSKETSKETFDQANYDITKAAMFVSSKKMAADALQRGAKEMRLMTRSLYRELSS